VVGRRTFIDLAVRRARSTGSAGSSLGRLHDTSGVAILLVLRTLQECTVASAATLGTLRKLDEDGRDALR
jgi:hypothetical protein